MVVAGGRWLEYEWIAGPAAEDGIGDPPDLAGTEPGAVAPGRAEEAADQAVLPGRAAETADNAASSAPTAGLGIADPPKPAAAKHEAAAPVPSAAAAGVASSPSPVAEPARASGSPPASPAAARPVLVFLHDGLGCVETWRDFPAALAAATGCAALVYSRAGYGASDAAPGPRPVGFMHDEALVILPRLLDELAVESAILVGHSDGASIALLHAAGPDLAAGRVRGMILEAPHLFVEPVCLESIARLRTLYRESDLAGRMARRHGAKAEHCFASWVEVWLRPEFREWNIEETVPRVRCPLLVVQGRQDEYGTLAQVRAIAEKAAAPVATLLLDDCGHTPHHQQRTATLAAMSAFVRRLVRRACGPARKESGPRRIGWRV
jgi:pimeloyl-ACP methyl ester carboxylesterase